MKQFCLFAVFYYFLGGIAIGLGLHRMLAYRAFVLPKWLEYLIITLSLPAGTPIQWVGTHRFHHHAFPRSAKHGLLEGQFDWTWQVIRALRLLRLARNVWLPREEDIRAELVAT